MYSWGDDTSTWNKPGTYDYGSARAPYLDELAKKAKDNDNRTYLSKKGPDMTIVDPKGKMIRSESKNPIVIGIDGTGSMQSWPAEIFDRLPLLYQTLSKYRDDVELSFSVIGDGTFDQWPVQASDFGKGPALDDYLKALHAEGKGGPGIRESYELWGYFMLNHCETPNAPKPIMLLMGDEKFYETVKPEQVQKYLGRTTQVVDSMTMWKELAERFDIWHLRKPYEGKDKEIITQWSEAIGAQHVISVADPLRVVDVGMGIVAKLWGYASDFDKNLGARQDEASVDAVKESLRYMGPPIAAPDQKSKLGKTAGTKKSKGLTEV